MLARPVRTRGSRAALRRVWRRLVRPLSDRGRSRRRLAGLRDRVRRGSLSGYRNRARICPRTCYTEVGRREFYARTGLLGRARIGVRFTFETENCPDCGTKLLTECGRCRAPILAPVSARCHACGLPQPWAPERAAGPGPVRARQWHPDKVPAGLRAATKIVSFPGGTLWIVQGDITEIVVDAIVSDDDVDGKMWTQVASAIKRAAGEEVEWTAEAQHRFEPGHTWPTGRGALKHVKDIIHVALMDASGQTNLGYVELCLRNALALAVQAGHESIAIAAIGTAPHAVKHRKWLRAAAEVAVAFLHDRDDGGKALDVIVILYDPKDFDGEVGALRRAALRATAKREHPALYWRWAVAAPLVAVGVGAAVAIAAGSLVAGASVAAGVGALAFVGLRWLWRALTRSRTAS